MLPESANQSGSVVPTPQSPPYTEGRLWKYAWGSFLALTICCLGFVSWRQAATYRSEETLWTAVLKKNPNSWQAHNHLGAALYMRGDVKGARAQFSAAVRVNPDNSESHNNLELALMGRMNEFRTDKPASVSIKDNSAMRTNLANAYLQVKQYDNAIKNYIVAIKLSPVDTNAPAHRGLGYAYMQIGKVDEAIPEFMRTIEIDPAMPQGRNDLIQALKMKGIDPSGPPPKDKTYPFDVQKALELLKRGQ
jgi:Flp pilus assembly protein TadD